jgi:hypothetical protein
MAALATAQVGLELSLIDLCRAARLNNARGAAATTPGNVPALHASSSNWIHSGVANSITTPPSLEKALSFEVSRGRLRLREQLGAVNS